MELTVRCFVQKGSSGVLVLAFSEAPNADRISAALDQSLGREVDVTLRWPERQAGLDRESFNGEDPSWSPPDFTDDASEA